MNLIFGLIPVFVLLSVVMFPVVGNAESDEMIPKWVKGIVVFWGDSEIDDTEFIDALEYLINAGVITVDNPRVSALEKEILELKQKVQGLKSDNSTAPDDPRVPVLERENQELKQKVQELESGGNATVNDPRVSELEKENQKLKEEIQQLESGGITLFTTFGQITKGDDIILSGKVSPVSDLGLTMRIIAPGNNIVLIGQLVSTSSGDFTTTVSTDDDMWNKSGVYIIELAYGDHTHRTDFNFKMSSETGGDSRVSELEKENRELKQKIQQFEKENSGLEQSIQTLKKEIEVLERLSEGGMQITVEEGSNIPGSGQIITIKVIGAKQTVDIEIISPDNEIIETLSFPASAQGEINLPWIFPKNTEPGTYAIRASDAFNSAYVTVKITESMDNRVTITTGTVPLGIPGCEETNECYIPGEATVDVGGKVIMTNTDATQLHSYTSGTVDGFTATPDGTFDSELQKEGESLEWIPDTVGEYPYYCTIHVWMQGTITVQEVS